MTGCGLGIKCSWKRGWKIRYLTLTRISTADYMDPMSIEMWYRRKRYYAVNGFLLPHYDISTPWQNANDDNYGTFAHTEITEEAIIQLDFGEDVLVTRVRVVHRGSRGAGTRLTATDSSDTVILQLDTNDSTAVETVAIYPSTAAVVRTSFSDWNNV